MPLEGSFDIYGSHLIRGYSGSNVGRAMRRHLLKVPNPGTPTSADLKTVLDAWEAEEGLLHHVDTTLPLATLTAQKFGPGKVLLTANYQQILGSGGFQGANVLIADKETAVDICQVYRKPKNASGVPVFTANGLPGGEVDVPNPAAQKEDVKPTRTMYQRPASRITVRTTLNASPYTAVLPLYAHTNAGAITFLTILAIPDAGPESVLFEGAHERIRNQGGLIKYDVAYQFLGVFGKFYEQQYKWNPATSVFDVEDVPKYPTADFADAFPY